MKAKLDTMITIEDYHAMGDISKHGFQEAVLSKSMLSDLSPPALFKYKHIDGNRETNKDYFNVGNAVHTLALEPELFQSRFYVIKEGVRRDDRTAKYQRAILEAGGRKMITANSFESIKNMAKILASHKIARKLLEEQGAVEASIFWEDPETGLKLRSRPDFMRGDGVVIDLKTAADASPQEFFRMAWRCHYDVSAALTEEGYKALHGKEMQNYIFLVIEKEPPHMIEIYDTRRPDTFGNVSYLEAGQVRLRSLLAKYQECVKNNHWPSYNDKIEPMGYPYSANKFLTTGEL